jgi:hypothetical protein
MWKLSFLSAPFLQTSQEDNMEKLIGRWSYWTGIICAAIAILWRLANVFSFLPFSTMRTGFDISFLSFLHVGFLLFIVTMATACYSFLASQK